MRTTRCFLVLALLFTCLFLVRLRLVSAQAQPQAPAAPAATTAAAPAQGTAAPAPSAEEQPIRALLDAFAKAYSKPDLNALAACITDDAVVIDSAGESTR